MLIGLALWVASVGVAFFTSDVVLLPTIVLLGSFLIPVTAVVWYLDHDPSPALSPGRIVAGFVIAGVIGVLAAWGLTSFGTREGIVLGATVGFGFAALESSGYALASLFVVQGVHLFLSLTSVVLTELVRGVLAPFGHGLWSAILGGVIFGGAGRGRLRITWSVVAAYVGVSILHAAFDSLGGIAGYVVISIIGLVPLVYLWWRGDRTGQVRRHERVPSAPIVAQR